MSGLKTNHNITTMDLELFPYNQTPRECAITMSNARKETLHASNSCHKDELHPEEQNL